MYCLHCIKSLIVGHRFFTPPTSLMADSMSLYAIMVAPQAFLVTVSQQDFPGRESRSCGRSATR